MATRYIDSYCFAIRRWTFVRRRLLWTFLPTILLAIPLYYHCSGSGSDQDPPPKSDPVTQQTVHLAVVACDQRLEEALMMVKSAVTFGRAPLHVHVFTDSNLWWTFSESVRPYLSGVWMSHATHVSAPKLTNGASSTIILVHRLSDQFSGRSRRRVEATFQALRVSTAFSSGESP